VPTLKLNVINENILLVWHKKLRKCKKVWTPTNYLGLVEGRGITFYAEIKKVFIHEKWCNNFNKHFKKEIG
jgi:hypothetical protein